MRLIKAFTIIILLLFLSVNFNNILANKIDNQIQTCNNQYNMVIITSKSLIDGFRPLVNRHEEDGLNTLCYPVEEIYKNYEGVDNTEKIRNFIRFSYQTYGIEYVLLGGDCQIIPNRNLYLAKEWINYDMHYYTGPSDTYYSCLDGSYNSDKDEYWGEPNDGENGEDVDLNAEVYVGRACVDGESDVDNFVSKTISYMDADDYYLSKVLLVGEWYAHTGPLKWFGNDLDNLIDSCNQHDFTTTGIPSNKFMISKLYDRDIAPRTWDKSEVKDLIDTNYHIINHGGHSWYNLNMRMNNQDARSLSNDKPSFIYSYGCMAGGFDNPEGYDCIAEDFTVKTNNGAFAGIWNSRNGKVSGPLREGPSLRYNREFWDAVFGEKILTISKAHQDSKEDNIRFINEKDMRWCYYQLNYFGDPAISFHIPDKINYPPETPILTYNKDEIILNVSSCDPEEHQIRYGISWKNNGNINKWTAKYYESGKNVTIDCQGHKGTIGVIAEDIFGGQSPWSTIEVNSKTRIFKLFDNIILRLPLLKLFSD